jgi:hypothetical protein
MLKEVSGEIPAEKAAGSAAKGTGSRAEKNDERDSVPEWIQLRLWVKSGGRCEFNGCNEDLYTEKLTLKNDKLAQIAHIVGAKTGPKSPRGDYPLAMELRNQFDNLMLVCMEHHNHFDKRYEKDYPVELLRSYKKDHEDRVDWLMSLPPGSKTKIVRLRTKIGTETACITERDYRQAILPRYPFDKDGIEINLTTVPESGSAAYWQSCMDIIEHEVSTIHKQPVSGPAIEHVSVFGLAPIPLLMYLGRSLGNKVPAVFFQRHRDTEDWCWKESSDQPANYVVEHLQHGEDPRAVVVVMSLSGTVAVDKIHPEIRHNRDLYVVALDGQAPSTAFLNTREDLERFRHVYQRLLARIRAERAEATEVHLFPAVPSPVALTCGRELLQGAHPSLLVYNFSKTEGAFKFALKVN